MELLTSADWKRLHKFFQVLYAPCSLEAYPARLLDALPEQIGSELNGIFSSNLKNATALRVITSQHSELGKAATNFTEQPQAFHLAHPVIENYLNTSKGEALAISDFLSEAELNRLNLPWVHFAKQFQIVDQMGIFIELPAALRTASKADPFHQGQAQLCFLLGRDCRSFTERERLILNIIRPHLQQAYDTLTAFDQLQHQLSEQQSALDQAALIAISASGAVQWMTQPAGEILRRYFPPTQAVVALPDLLQQWIRRQLAKFSQAEAVNEVTRPLKLQLDERQLTIRVSYCAETEHLYLLLEETVPEEFSVESLQWLGLTKRESEVLFWVAKDKSLMEVASLLGISDRTAKKHLEHIYEKFGVQTRLSAVMYALKHLGIFG